MDKLGDEEAKCWRRLHKSSIAVAASRVKNRRRGSKLQFSDSLRHYRVRQKSNPLKFFAVFSATAWNFNMEFYRFIYRNVLHLTAKWNMILLKNDEIIDFW